MFFYNSRLHEIIKIDLLAQQIKNGLEPFAGIKHSKLRPQLCFIRSLDL